MDDRELWSKLGLHGAVAAYDAERRLTPDEVDAMPTYQLWQRLGLRHVTLADAVAERKRLKGE